MTQQNESGGDWAAIRTASVFSCCVKVEQSDGFEFLPFCWWFVVVVIIRLVHFVLLSGALWFEVTFIVDG